MDRNQAGKISLAGLIENPGSLITARIFLLLLVVLSAASLPPMIARGQGSGNFIASFSLLWVTLLSLVGLISLLQLAGLGLLFWSSAWIEQKLGGLTRVLSRVGWANWVGVVGVWLAYVAIVLWRYQKHFADFPSQVWMFFLVVGLGAFFLKGIKYDLPSLSALLFLAVIYAAGVTVLGFLPDISSFPFSLSWSEGSRYYYASLPYAPQLYGEAIPLSFLHPSRYLLQSIAFWLPGAGIWAHRFWQVLLWLFLDLLTGIALARRFKLSSFPASLVVSLWAVLFLLQGPIYYHLLVCVALVLFGFERRNFWKTLLYVVLGSAWAGISRVNWIPVPVMLAACLYFLEQPVSEDPVLPGWLIGASRKLSSLWKKFPWIYYLWPPFLWGIAGGAAALAAQAGYMLVSRQNDASSFGSSFSSPLLWYRLLPSFLYPLGVIPAILLVSAPLLIWMVVSWVRGRASWHWIRVTGLAGMLLVLFGGGLVVSAKIGGGSNIHNMDAYLALLLIVGSSIATGTFGAEADPTGVRPAQVLRSWPLLMAVVLVPVIWNLNVGEVFVQHDFKQAQYDLDKLNQIVQTYAPQGEILFITQRQLVVFHLVPGVRMSPDYELMTLMEMAMSDNQAYFARFDKDLQNHRFALIVSDRQQRGIQDPDTRLFAEENNAWVEHVSNPILRYYREKMFFETQGIQLLVPKE